MNTENFRIYFDAADILPYTVVFTNRPEKGNFYECLCISLNGITFEHSSAQRGNHLGKIIPYQKLPEPVKEVINLNL